MPPSKNPKDPISVDPKQETIKETIKEVIAKLPFKTIESCSDTLFDLKEREDKEAIAKRVEFLRKTKLSEINYLDTNNQAAFKISNQTTREFILVSNRLPTNGEFRGENIRNFLNKQKDQNDQESVYDAMTRAIKNPEYSDEFRYLRSACTMELPSGVPSMSTDHFDLFTNVLLAKVLEKIEEKKQKGELSPEVIAKDEKLQGEIFDGIETDKIYDSTKLWTSLVEEIKAKGKALWERGYPQASNHALDLYNDLTEQKNNFCVGKIGVQVFATDCKRLIERAEQSELKNHRGFFGNIWHAIKVALNVLTFGAVAVTPTTSIQKTMAIKQTLEGLTSPTENNPEEENLPPPSQKI